MKLVIIGLVMTAISMNGSDSDSDWVSDTHHKVNSDIEVCAVSSKKRKMHDSEPEISSNSRFYGRKHSVGKDAQGKLLYKSMCCSKIGHFDTTARHMHAMNKCFDYEGYSCRDCNGKSEKTYNALEMLQHNKQFHSDLYYWKCRFCGTSSIKNDEWVRHLAHYTRAQDVPMVFEQWPDENLIVTRNHKNTLSKFLNSINQRKQSLTDDNTLADLERISALVLASNGRMVNFTLDNNTMSQQNATNLAQVGAISKNSSNTIPEIDWQLYTVVGDKNNRKMVRLSEIIHITED